MCKIAIAISTYNRKEVFNRTLAQFKKHTQKDIPIFIVDGGSAEQYAKTNYQFNYRATISEVKNKCLQLAYQSNAKHIFLFDDDTYPISDNWHIPYIQSDWNHLCYTFLNHYGFDKKIKRHYLANGCGMYFTRTCIDTVGGFDTNYKNKYEHVDLSRRIYNNRLTPTPFADVIQSNQLLYCLDKDDAIKRTFSEDECNAMINEQWEYFKSKEKSTDYIEFRT